MKTIKIIFTGGTITMKKDANGLLVPAVSGQDLVDAVPTLAKLANIETIQFSHLSSSQMSPALCIQLRQKIIDVLLENETAAVVVVHGTDTMEETAFFLDLSLSDSDLQGKPVVLTGAMLNADDANGDGSGDLLGAVLAAVDPESRGRGVLLVMNQSIHAARWVRKMDTSSVDTFVSTNAPSGLSLGRLCVETPNYSLSYVSEAKRYLPYMNLPIGTIDLPRVDIINMYSGADGVLVKASLSAGAKAIVVNAVGAGNVNVELYESLVAALHQGVAVVVCSRCPFGLVAPVYGYVGGGQKLQQEGALFAHDLSAQKARIFIQLALLQKNVSRETLMQYIQELQQK